MPGVFDLVRELEFTLGIMSDPNVDIGERFHKVINEINRLKSSQNVEVNSNIGSVSDGGIVIGTNLNL